jgi:hypothetical protein
MCAKEKIIEERQKNKKQLNISKEDFVSTLETIIKVHKKYEAFDKALRDVCDGYPIFLLGGEYLNSLIYLLEKGCFDPHETVSWWLFESPEKVIWISPNTELNPSDKEIEVDVSTPEKLYEYFEMW